MYATLLLLHSWTRWILLLVILLVIIRALNGWLNGKAYTKADAQAGVFYAMLMRLQFVLGLVLYFVSPFGFPAIQRLGMGAVMKDSAIRPWAIEHIFMMFIVIALAEISTSKTKKISTDKGKHKTMAIFTIIALVLILAAIRSRLLVVQGF
jgi:small-conductance mechanosensitive channel